MAELTRQWNLYHPVNRELVAAWDIDYAGVSELVATWDFDYAGAGEELVAAWDIDYEGLPQAPLVVAWGLPYFGITTPAVASVDFGLDYDGEPLASLVSIEYVFTRLSYKNTISVTLADAADFALCAVGEYLNLRLAGRDIPLVVVGRGRSRSLDNWVYTVSLESPGAVLDYPFAVQESGYLTGTSSTIAASLAGSVALNWNTVSWPITSEIFAAADRTPREIMTALAETAGGLLLSEFDGAITVEPDYPISVPLWDAATTDYTVDAVGKVISDSYSGELEPLYNAVYVGSSAADSDANAVTINSEEQDDGSMLVRVCTAPWDDDLSFEQTGGASVSVEYVGDEIRSLTETVEIVGGEGYVSLPALSLVSYTYQDDDLGAVTLDDDGHCTTATAGESLVSITYLNRSRNYRLRSTTGADVQVVAESIDSDAEDDTILIVRGAGDVLGEDIYDQLLTSDAVRRERGRNFIDGASSMRETMSVAVNFTELYRPGALIKVVDPVDGEWVGLLQEQSGSISVAGSLTVTSQLTIEREQT